MITSIRGISKGGKMTQDTATQMQVAIGLFRNSTENLSDERLIFLMDNLIRYMRSGYCREYEYWSVRRALTEEWSKRLRARA